MRAEMSTALQSRPRLPRAQVDPASEFNLRLDEAFSRLHDVYAGHQKVAIPGTSPQYVSSVLHRGTPCSLARFVELVSGLSMSERAFVLGSLIEDAPAPELPPLLEVAEATEATAAALASAERILAAPTVSPREIENMRHLIHKAERELEDVECSIERGRK
jgi:hypothetical protein